MIYYVEDDTNIRDLAVYALGSAGLEACGYPSAEPFLAACAELLPDLILLDIMLPGIDGLELLGRIRSNPDTAAIPVMMLSAKGSEFDKVRGLDAGADDYLAKPFGMMELVSRCNALLRRAGMPAAKTPSETYECGAVRLDAGTREVRVAGETLELTPKEFDLLAKLMSVGGRALSRQQLLEEVWGVTFMGESRTVDTHVQTTRRKINDLLPGAGDIIQTVRGVGYQVKAQG